MVGFTHPKLELFNVDVGHEKEDDSIIIELSNSFVQNPQYLEDVRENLLSQDPH